MEPANTNSPPQTSGLSSGKGAAIAAVLVLAFLAWLLACTINASKSSLADDSYITYHYGRNVAEGHGLRFNATDEEPTSGASSLLHVLLAALFHLAGWDPLTATRLLSLLLYLTIPLAFAWSASRITRAPPGVLLLSSACLAVAYAMIPETGPHIVSGMETMIFTATHAWVVAWAGVAAVGRPRKGWTSIGVALLLIVLVLARPEGLLLAVAYVAVVVGLRRSSGERPAAIVASLRWVLLPFLVFVGAFFAWKILTFGQLASNPFYVKTNNQIFGSSGALLPGRDVTTRFLATRYLPLLASVALAAFSTSAGRRVWVAGSLLLLPGFATVLLYARAIHEMAGHYRYEYTLMVPLLGVLVVWTGSLWSRAPRAVLAVAGAAGLFVPLLFSPSGFRFVSWLGYPRSAATAWLDFVNDGNAQSRMGRDLQKTGLDSEATILLSGAGQVPYFSGFRSIDWIGLNNNELSGREARSMDEVWDYIEGEEPDVVYSILPPASLDGPGCEGDPGFQSSIVQSILDGRGSALFRFWERDRLAEMFCREMRYIRDEFEFGASYKLGSAWGGDWWLFAYVRRDSPHRAAISRVFDESPWTDVTSRLELIYGTDPRELGHAHDD